MTDIERAQILKMIEDGRITPEEGLKLMNALGDEPQLESEIDDDVNDFVVEKKEVYSSESKAQDDFASRVNRFRNLWMIPLWVGVIVIILGSGLMSVALQKSGMGFWFLCSTTPFALGVIMVALAFASRTARWLYVKVHQKNGEKPEYIAIGFPIPFGIVRWAIRNFGHNIPDQHRTVVDDVMKTILNEDALNEPLFVDVKEGDHDVQVYIG